MKFHHEKQQFKPVTIVLETPEECAAYAALFNTTVAEDRLLGLDPDKQGELYRFLKDASGDAHENLRNKVSVTIEVKEV